MAKNLHTPAGATHVVKVESEDYCNSWEVWGYAFGWDDVAGLKQSAGKRKTRVEVIR